MLYCYFNNQPLISSLPAGKGGIISLLQTNQVSESDKSHKDKNLIENKEGEEEEELVCSSDLMSFKAHARWISTALFLSDITPESESLLIISSSDDATIKIWDLYKSSINRPERQPKLINTSNHIHQKGIFAMDLKNRLLLTGSKDKRVAFSRILDDCTVQLDRVFEFHTGVVKSVSWQGVITDDFASSSSQLPSSTFNSNVFLSAGQDRRVCLHDTRSNNNQGYQADIEMNDVLTSGIHTITWNGFAGILFPISYFLFYVCDTLILIS
jgi:WD40 repeat protein